MKAVSFPDSNQDGLTLDSFNLEFINFDSLSGDNITKENNLRLSLIHI